MSLQNWLFFLGAGASAPDPCDLPPFGPLSGEILSSIGWKKLPEREEDFDRWRYGEEPYYPDIARLDTAAEVLFGTLSRFGVKFVNEVCHAFSNATPNAVHEAAAHVLRAKGCVWTTNIDDAVERACSPIGLAPHRTGRLIESRKRELLHIRKSPLLPLDQTGVGTYVKFHGTVEAPRSLAFTDRQLIAPLSTTDVDHLASMAEGRTLVFYGYAGADADIANLLDVVISDAAEVYWFEPKMKSRSLIAQAFPKVHSRIQFVPVSFTGTSEQECRHEVASAFLDFVSAFGHRPDADLSQLLVQSSSPWRDLGRLREPSGATQARLVERFGESASDDDKTAWNKAWMHDMRHFRIGSIRQHLRHRTNYSLYHEGMVAKVTSWLSDHRSVLRHLHPKSFRDYFVTRACALYARTESRGRDALSDFIDWAMAVRRDRLGRPYPSDLYYEAQVQRYALQPAEARATAENAVEGLVRITDLERLAGALYEAGDAALYQADFNAALKFAIDLRFRRGRYAIARWQAWGAWLEIMARAHLQDVGPKLNKTIEAMQSRFDFERGVLNCADGRTAQLLVARVRLAVRGSLELDSLDHPTDDMRPRRYRDDFELLRADIAIAQENYEEARTRLNRVLGCPAILISGLWARVGLAELERIQNRNDPTAAADEFLSVAEQAHGRGAAWLEAQALLGAHLCEDPRAEAGWERLKHVWPESGGVSLEDVRATPDQPARVLWMLTL